MFGYLGVEKSKLNDGEQGLYQTFMCGVCLSTKKYFSNKVRATISNDINFFNVLFHSVLNADVQISHARCMAHPFTKRTILAPTEITDKIAVCNVLLVALDIFDDVVDGGSLKKRLAYRAIKKDYHKAMQLMPQASDAFCESYRQLRTLEQANCNSIDKVAECFSNLSVQFAKQVLGDTCSDFCTTLCYNVGKWVYLADALDDIDKDIAKQNYNPFVSAYSLAGSQDVAKHLEDIQFEMFAVLNRIAQSYNDMNLERYTCLLNNIIYTAIRNKTTQILNKYRGKTQ